MPANHEQGGQEALGQGGATTPDNLERLAGALLTAAQAQLVIAEAQTAAVETFAAAAGILADQITALQGTLGQRSSELRTKRNEMVAKAQERGERVRQAIRELKGGTPPVSS